MISLLEFIFVENVEFGTPCNRENQGPISRKDQIIILGPVVDAVQGPQPAGPVIQDCLHVIFIFPPILNKNLGDA